MRSIYRVNRNYGNHRSKRESRNRRVNPKQSIKTRRCVYDNVFE